MDSLEFSSDSEDNAVVLAPTPSRWSGIAQRAVVSLFFPFINGVMLGFGEIFAHELGLVWGWRSAKVYDPTAVATSPRVRRKWLFGLA